MTWVALSFPEVKITTPAIPERITTTSGRPWLIDIFAVPAWVIFGSILPAILAVILLFLDQNITTRLVNAPEYKLKKGFGFHLDLLIVSLLLLVGSLFGLPWIVAATVHSLNHNKSLATTEIIETPGGVKKEVITGVRENRVSGLMIHVLILGSLFMLNLFSNIPMAVLYGLFLYMGITSLGGNQFYDRMVLWITDPKLIPKNHYTSKVPLKKIHLFTALQLICFVILWVLKSSKLGILFPLFIAALVPINNWINRFFDEKHIEVLLAEEGEDDDHYLG